MQTNTNSPNLNSPAAFSDEARIYATALRDGCSAAGFTIDARDVAQAFDAGRASQSALLAEAREVLGVLLDSCAIGSDSNARARVRDKAESRARALLAKMEGR